MIYFITGTDDTEYSWALIILGLGIVTTRIQQTSKNCYMFYPAQVYNFIVLLPIIRKCMEIY